MPASPYDDDVSQVLTNQPHTIKVAIQSVTVEEIESGKEPRGCQKCGETESQVYIVIDGKDYCRECAALVRLEGFHYRVTGDQ